MSERNNTSSLGMEIKIDIMKDAALIWAGKDGEKSQTKKGYSQGLT